MVNLQAIETPKKIVVLCQALIKGNLCWGFAVQAEWARVSLVVHKPSLRGKRKIDK